MQDASVHDDRLLRYCVMLTLFFLILTGVCAARPRKDVLQFANGDRIASEIIKLEKDHLYVKLEYAEGRVAMDWWKIARVDSPQSFVVADIAGKRYTGTLQSVAEAAEPARRNGRRPQLLQTAKPHAIQLSVERNLRADQMVGRRGL
jgi:hypothetical protein